jgi:hypothetical protein
MKYFIYSMMMVIALGATTAKAGCFSSACAEDYPDTSQIGQLMTPERFQREKVVPVTPSPTWEPVEYMIWEKDRDLNLPDIPIYRMK